MKTRQTTPQHAMKTDYIPTKDADFNNWSANFSTLATANPATYGLTAPIALIIAGLVATWAGAYQAATDPSTRTSATIAAKDQARAELTSRIRPYAVAVSMDPAVAPQAKVAIGVTLRGGPPTPVPAPTDAPSLAVNKGIPQNTQLSYSYAGAQGKAKPAGTIGVEIYRAVGAVHVIDPTQATYVGTVTKSPFTLSHEAGDSGKKATFFARFITRSGPGGIAQAGPWSAPLQIALM